MTSFEAFWSELDAELAATPSDAELQPLAAHDTQSSSTYLMRLTSIGGYRIAGYYCVPTTSTPSTPAPGILQTPRYGSVNHVPDYHDRERYAVLQLIHRGQRLADQPLAAAYPGLLTLGIEQPTTYIYRAMVADCLRGAEFLAGRTEVDATRLGAWGDDLALIAAARRPLFRAVLATDLLLYRLLEGAARSQAYPVEEVNDVLRVHPEQRESIANTLSYFDPRAHAPRIEATTLLPSGDDAAWLQPLREALAGRCEDYPLTHRGAIDQRWLDGWLAGQLGTQPRARFLARA